MVPAVVREREPEQRPGAAVGLLAIASISLAASRVSRHRVRGGGCHRLGPRQQALERIARGARDAKGRWLTKPAGSAPTWEKGFVANPTGKSGAYGEVQRLARVRPVAEEGKDVWHAGTPSFGRE